MTIRGLISLRLLYAISMAAVPALGQCDNLPPRYDSTENVDRPPNWHYDTLQDDARPGQKFYFLAVRALHAKEYTFAIDMYEVAASWAYKPAQYNLAMMYLKGEGVPVDRERAMAWMAMAAERNDPRYTEARELLYADLNADEFAHANATWRELKPTYRDDVALARAKMRWAQVRAAMTGSNVGGVVGNLRIGDAVRNPGASSGATLLGSGNQDGSIAYRQLRQRNSPYDSKFEWRISPLPVGTTTVGPISEIDAPGAGDSTTKPESDHHDFF